MSRRFELRRVVARPIEVIASAWDDPVLFSTGDLSPRGAYVHSELLPDLGEAIVCAFDLGSGCAFDFFGEVVRVNMLRRASDRGRPGFGVRFVDAKPLDRIKIRDALRHVPPPPFMRRPPRDGRIAPPPWGRADGPCVQPRLPRLY